MLKNILFVLVFLASTLVHADTDNYARVKCHVSGTTGTTKSFSGFLYDVTLTPNAEGFSVRGSKISLLKEMAMKLLCQHQYTVCTAKYSNGECATEETYSRGWNVYALEKSSGKVFMQCATGSVYESFADKKDVIAEIAEEKTHAIMEAISDRSCILDRLN